MWMPTAIRKRILRYLFENGVLVVSDNQSGMHEDLDCLNIYPFQIGRSFTSKGFCKKQYAWSHAYYTLTDKGIEYLRGYFGLPANAAPATLQPRQAELLQKSTGSHFGRDGPRGARGGFRGGRGGERSGGFRGARRGAPRDEAPAAEATE